MPDGPRPPSEYRAVWLFAMFDLPVGTPEDRKEYREFREELLRRGFLMLQYSVYARYYQSEEASLPHRQDIACLLPPEGQVRLMALTDHQFGKMDVFIGKKRAEVEPGPLQLLFF